MNNIHGGNIYSFDRKLIDFSTNINPFGVKESIIKKIINEISDIENYPDVQCKELRTKIAEKEKVGIENIICGNGAAELIFNIVYAVKPKKALLLQPTFLEYERAIDAVGADKKVYFLKKENDFIVEKDIIDYIDESIDIIFICNPNNPTGNVIEKKLLKKIIEKSSKMGIMVVVDECFMDFVDDMEKYSTKEYIKIYKNIFILKAFTKMYAISGLRLGYGISSNLSIMDKIYAGRQPWNVSVIAQKAGIIALDENLLQEETREYVKNEKIYLESSLKNMGIKYFKSFANYILFYTNKNLDKKLIEYDILIRNCSNYKGLEEGYYRIAVKKHKDNEKLVNALKNIVGVDKNG